MSKPIVIGRLAGRRSFYIRRGKHSRGKEHETMQMQGFRAREAKTEETESLEGMEQEQKQKQKHRLEEEEEEDEEEEEEEEEEVPGWLREVRPLRVLGRGDTGIVFLARHHASGRTVAMKVVPKTGMGSASTSNANANGNGRARRALTEARVLQRLRKGQGQGQGCPFVPRLYGVVESRRHVYLFTSYCPGGDLHLLRLMQRPRTTFSPSVAKFYAAEVVAALQFLHSRGVVYRDLKAENILVQASGHVMLSDFDLSLLLPDDAHAAAAGAAYVGTEEYVAPEVLWGAPHGFHLDWWALGILLYEMLYGRTPFKASCRRSTFINVLSADVAFPEQPQQAEDDELEACARDLIRRLLVKDPKWRLGSGSGSGSGSGCECRAMDVKSHAFFRGVHWDCLHLICRPPFVPPFSPFQLRHQQHPDTNIDILDDHQVMNG